MQYRGLAFSALAAVMAAVSLPSAAAKSHHKPACDAHRSKAKLVTAKVIVYGMSGNDNGVPDTTYYACLRPRGKSVKFGVSHMPPLDPTYDRQIREFTARGAFVAADEVIGGGAYDYCTKYNPPSQCKLPTQSVNVLDVKRHRAAAISLAGPPYDVVQIALSSSPALAYLREDNSAEYLWATPLHPNGKTFSSSPTSIDSGDIDPKSLTFHGDTLSWTNGGVAHQRVIQ